MKKAILFVILLALVIGILWYLPSFLNKAWISNPASAYCVENNGKVDIRKDSNGGEYGVCVFENGKECEEWALFHGECREATSVKASENAFKLKLEEKIYTGKDAKECRRSKFKCEEDREFFYDEEGCGCRKINYNEETPEFLIPTEGGINADKIVCTEEYAPVCGKIEVQCIKAPCDPVKQTFSNKCFAKKSSAFDVTEGECK